MYLQLKKCMTNAWITVKTICVGVVIATILAGVLAYFVGLRITTQRELDRTDAPSVECPKE